MNDEIKIGANQKFFYIILGLLAGLLVFFWVVCVFTADDNDSGSAILAMNGAGALADLFDLMIKIFHYASLISIFVLIPCMIITGGVIIVGKKGKFSLIIDNAGIIEASIFGTHTTPWSNIEKIYSKKDEKNPLMGEQIFIKFKDPNLFIEECKIAWVKKIKEMQLKNNDGAMVLNYKQYAISAPELLTALQTKFEEYKSAQAKA